MKITKLLGVITLSVLCASCVKDDSEVDEVQAKANKKAAGYNVQLGLGYLEQGNVQRAKRKLVMAMEQDPNSTDAVGAFAFYQEKTGNMREAKRYYQKALQLAPGKGPQLNNYGAFLCRQGHYLEAIKYFDAANRDMRYENSSGALENAGLCAEAIPNLTMAQAYFQKAVEQDPKRLKSIYELAKIAFDFKQYDKSLRYVAEFEKHGPIQAPTAWLGYQAATKAGKSKQAESYAWMLRNRFAKSAEYKKLLVRNQNYVKQKRGVS